MSTDEKTGMGNETPSMSAEDEMAGLKKRAKMMGMTVSNNIGLETLRTRVRNVLESGKKPQEEEPEPEQEITPVAAALTKVEPKAAKVETESEKRKRIMKSAMRLIRIRITCLNPAKKDLPGQIVTVGNNVNVPVASGTARCSRSSSPARPSA